VFPLLQGFSTCTSGSRRGFPFYFFYLLLWSCRDNWNCPPAWWSAVRSLVRIILCWNCWLVTILVWLTERLLYTFVENCDQKCFSLWMSTPLCCLCPWFFCHIKVGFICLCSRFLNVFFFQPLLFCCMCDILFWLVCLRLYRHLGQCFHLCFFSIISSIALIHLLVF